MALTEVLQEIPRGTSKVLTSFAATGGRDSVTIKLTPANPTLGAYAMAGLVWIGTNYQVPDIRNYSGSHIDNYRQWIRKR